MFYDEPKSPHFHATYCEFSAEISINELIISAGNLPSRALGLVIEWASLHQPELYENWNRIENGELIKKISPLD